MPVRVNDKRRSERDTAAEMVRLFLEEMQTHSNLAAIVRWLVNSPRSVQRQVLNDLRGPHKPGAPRKGIPDEDWLLSVESWREQMERINSPGGRRPSDLAVISDWLSQTGTRYGREKDKPFQPNREAGKAEVRRIRDAIVRARRRRKIPPQKA